LRENDEGILDVFRRVFEQSGGKGASEQMKKGASR